MSGWSEDHVARLTTLFREGKSYGQIAALLNREFHTAYSRNAVCGKCDRLGLERGHDAGMQAAVHASRQRPAAASGWRALRRPAPQPKPFVAKPPTAWTFSGDPSTPPHLKKLAAIRANEAARQAATAEPPPTREELPGRCDLLSLEPHMCRWPIGDPALNLTFCGRQREGAGPYCAKHTRAASASSGAKARLDDRLGITQARRAG